MKTRIGIFILILTLGATGASQAAEGEAVVNSAKRQEVLSLAKTLLATPSPAVVGKNPFQVEAGVIDTEVPVIGEIEDKKPDGPLNAKELLQAIATSPSLKPSGVFTLPGGPVLLFGQKRVKAGGILNITFEGTEYALEIVSIVPPNFTLRLNREEFTRPIK
jgi:hypothetical protein